MLVWDFGDCFLMTHLSKLGPNPQLDIWLYLLCFCGFFFFWKPAFKLTWDLHGKVLFLLLYQIRPTNFLVDGMFYKSVLFWRWVRKGSALVYDGNSVSVVALEQTPFLHNGIQGV